jgi:hypothetical protein
VKEVYDVAEATTFEHTVVRFIVPFIVAFVVTLITVLFCYRGGREVVKCNSIYC